MEYSITELFEKGYYPQRPPFVYIDRLTGYTEEYLSAEKKFSIEDIPDKNDDPVPLTIILECFAQLTNMIGLLNPNGYEEFCRDKTKVPDKAFLIGINACTKHGDAYAGDTVQLKLELIRKVGMFIIVKGIAFVKDKIIAEAELSVLSHSEFSVKATNEN